MGYNARWYTDEGNLRSLGRVHLGNLADKYKNELAGAGITIPQPIKDEEYYKELAAVFMRPEGIPAPLHEALYYIKGLDNQSGFDRIIQAVNAGKLKISMTEDSSIADKALQAWLQNEQLVRQMHVEVGLDASKSFLHFRAREGKKPKLKDFAKIRPDLEKSLGMVFEDRGRGFWCEVTSYLRDKEIVFVIRHGEPFRRETQRVKQGTEPLFFWPSSQDLVVYNKEYCDLRMNVSARWLKEAYADNFGHWLFGDGDIFTEAPLYTLEPIRTRKHESLVGQLYGIESIALAELHCGVNEDTNDYRVRRADDVLEAYEKEGGIPKNEPLTLAKFAVKFSESGRERVVTIQPPNRAKYTQDRDGQSVAAWLRDAGFVLPRQEADFIDE